MSSPEEVAKQAFLSREDAFKVANDLEKRGVDIVMHSAPRGWRLEPKRHTDLVVLVEVCKAHELNVLYCPFGADEGITIYAGSKP